MSDLISRQKVIKRIEELPNSPNGYSATYDKASIIMAIEDVEPAEFVHAHWIEEDDGWGNPYWTCSHCREPWWLEEGTPEDNNMFFCMNCGAKMDEEAE